MGFFSDEMQDFVKNFIQLIEDTYTLNDKKKVILVGRW